MASVELIKTPEFDAVEVADEELIARLHVAPTRQGLIEPAHKVVAIATRREHQQIADRKIALIANKEVRPLRPVVTIEVCNGERVATLHRAPPGQLVVIAADELQIVTS